MSPERRDVEQTLDASGEVATRRQDGSIPSRQPRKHHLLSVSSRHWTSFC